MKITQTGVYATRDGREEPIYALSVDGTRLIGDQWNYNLAGVRAGNPAKGLSDLTAYLRPCRRSVRLRRTRDGIRTTGEQRMKASIACGVIAAALAMAAYLKGDPHPWFGWVSASLAWFCCAIKEWEAKS